MISLSQSIWGTCVECAVQVVNQFYSIENAWIFIAYVNGLNLLKCLSLQLYNGNLQLKALLQFQFKLCLCGGKHASKVSSHSLAHPLISGWSQNGIAPMCKTYKFFVTSHLIFFIISWQLNHFLHCCCTLEIGVCHILQWIFVSDNIS